MSSTRVLDSMIGGQTLALYLAGQLGGLVELMGHISGPWNACIEVHSYI